MPNPTTSDPSPDHDSSLYDMYAYPVPVYLDSPTTYPQLPSTALNYPQCPPPSTSLKLFVSLQLPSTVPQPPHRSR